MRFLAVAAVLLSVSSALAYQITSPGGSQGWTTSGPNYLKWERVDTDPLNFTVVLTNVNGVSVMPNGDQVLNALVNGTLGNITCNPPSGGWPTGDGFRVNLVQDAEHLNSILAQSSQFSINSTSTTTTGSSKTVTNPAQTQTIASTSTPSDISSSPTNVGAALPGVDAKSGLVAALAALAAFITTV